MTVHIQAVKYSIGDTGKPDGSTASFCLLLPGKTLNLSNLLAQKKFRGRGNKDGALAAFRELEEAGLGTLLSTHSDRGAKEVRQFTD